MVQRILAIFLLVQLAVLSIEAKRPNKHHHTAAGRLDGQTNDLTASGNGADDSGTLIAERVVAKKNPQTGELELQEQKVLVNVEPDDDDTADEVDNSATGADTSGYPKINPCAANPCEEGLECELNEFDQPVCVCMKQCPTNSPIKVCSSLNTTFDSECHMYRQRCLCQRGLPGCDDPRNKDLQLEYLRECQELALCTQDELADFPRRMGDWLFQIMKELANRNQLEPQYKRYEKRSEKKYQPGQPLPHPILWKFCDLDKGPNDRYISRKELLPIRAPLIPMEHCIAPFLDDCDMDNDHKLTLTEWGNCLKLKEEEIEDICAQAMQSTIKRPRASGDLVAEEDDEVDETDE